MANHPNHSTKETLRQSGYRYAGYDRATGLHRLQDIETGRIELFVANKDHASWGIKWRNTDLEYCRGA